MRSNTRKSANNYWVGLAATFGLTLAVIVMTEWPWPLIEGAVFILFLVLQGIHYGQIGGNVQRELGSNNAATTSLLASAFTAAAILVRSSEIAAWVGPVLGFVTFLCMYLYLKKYATFHQQAPDAANYRGVPD